MRAQGFTLLEVLVVLLILGLMTGVAVISLRQDPQSRLDQQARLLAQDFTYARDLAIQRHRLVGWHLQAQQSHFSQRTSLGEWQAYVSRALPTRQLPDGMILRASVDWQSDQEAQQGDWPQLIFMPDGSVTPLTLHWQYQEAERALRLSAQGVEWLSEDAP